MRFAVAGATKESEFTPSHPTPTPATRLPAQTLVRPASRSLVARPRSFNPDCALDAARAVFETHGYEATSVQTLVDATGLSRSSLYAAFGDKQALYLAALDRYRQAGRATLAQRLAGAPTPLDGIRAALDAAASDRPCFAFNAAADRSATCPDTARRAAEGWAGTRDAFADALRRAQATTALGADCDADALADTLAATLYGLHGMRQAGTSEQARRRVVATAFEALIGGV